MKISFILNNTKYGYLRLGLRWIVSKRYSITRNVIKALLTERVSIRHNTVAPLGFGRHQTRNRKNMSTLFV